ncbi:MAG: hypothetical protein Q9P90_06600 [candidate division KSB1 bacterium]|nr:hypothetical protein [candidate division KSB1 bacterium]
MQVQDVLCSAILPGDIQKGLAFAVAAMAREPAAFEESHETVQSYLDRLRELILAKCAEAATIRFLRAHGVKYLPVDFDGPAELMALRIKTETALIRPMHVSDAPVGVEDILRAHALLWLAPGRNEWPLRKRVDRLIFTFTSGRLTVTLQQDLMQLLQPVSPPALENFSVSARRLQVFLAAAPSVQECELRFRRLPAGHACTPFEQGLPYPAMGCPIRELSAFRRVVEWGGV